MKQTIERCFNQKNSRRMDFTSDGMIRFQGIMPEVGFGIGHVRARRYWAPRLSSTTVCGSGLPREAQLNFAVGDVSASASGVLRVKRRTFDDP